MEQLSDSKQPVIEIENAQVYLGSNLDILPTLTDNSVDSIVTDPPYELGFMGKKWDSSGIAYSVELWTECMRVLKPGGHLLAFGGSRTWHRLAVAIEDAGFEMRDSIAWLYGSGFPKSMDISKQIDKRGGHNIGWFGSWLRTWREEQGISQKEIATLFPSKTGNLTGCVANWELGLSTPTAEQFSLICKTYNLPFASIEEAEREVIGSKMSGIANKEEKERHTIGASKAVEVDITAPATPEAQKWQGWGTALKPAFEPVVVARKPLEEKTVAANVLKYGTGGLNIDGSRIGTETITTTNGKGFAGSFDGGTNDNGGNTHTGRWPANVILGHTPDCQPTGQTITSKTGAGKRTATFGTQETQSGGDGSGAWSGYEYQTEVYACVDGCPVKLLDEQSGILKSGLMKAGQKTKGYNGPTMGKFEPGQTLNDTYGDSGGASRFFYVAKASKKDRNEGLDELPIKRPDVRTSTGMGTFEEKGVQPQRNFHPTVKPTALMEYLIKLVTPPNGTVLDPFTGSGSTGKAALLNGFKFIGIELTEEYLPIIEGRLKWAIEQVSKGKDEVLF